MDDHNAICDYTDETNIMADQTNQHGMYERVATAIPLAVAPLLVTLLAFAYHDPGLPEPVEAGGSPSLASLETRAAVVDYGLHRVDGWYRAQVRPVEEILQPFHQDDRWVRRVAMALVREAEVVDMDPRALASVLLVENPWLDPVAESTVGAVGLMQVMPVHAGGWACGSSDLTDVEINICHGARIFAHYLDRKDGDLDRALLAYNGCVRGTNTPNCHLYPSHVYSRAGRAAMKRWLASGD